MVQKKKGRPTKYSKEFAEQIAEELTHSTIEETCKKLKINPDTYYTWVNKHEEFAELSTKARKTKAIKHFNECENILRYLKDKRYDESIRSDIVRLELDFHLRLAGKANQGLFGDASKNNVNLNIDSNKDVSVPDRVHQKEWLESL